MPWTRARRRVARLVDEVAPRHVEAAVAQASDAGWRIDTAERYCTRCGAGVHISAVTREGCPFCVDKRLAWHRMTRLAGYEPPMTDWIKAMKFGRQWRWAPWLGRELAERIGPALDRERVAVVPVPMHWWRRTGRGFDQARLMAAALAEARGWPVVPAIRRQRHARPQSSLALSRRSENVRRCYAGHAVDLSGYQVILVDDVKTTGATLTACARLLRRQGARTIHAAVAAVADPRGQGFETI